MTKPDGGRAFPRPVSDDRTQGDQPDGNRTVVEQAGMTLRDYFAAKAMAGMLAAMETTAGRTEQQMASAFAGVAYVVADAMLAERAK